ncbi:MAG: tetratricopeptide repeat protein [Patescibacteria group bacterium]|nr:tetratricopeptide repeat protein [Patescibacteria group bacterium]
MSLEDSSNGVEREGDVGSDGREPVSPAKRKRLQKVFEHASKQMSQDNHDYATTLLIQCVVGDPGNLIYVQSYVGNLQKKYKNNRKGANFVAQLSQRGAKNAARKAIGQEKWMDVISSGLKVLTVNPWDVATLLAMATASEKMGDDEVELFYLKSALQANMNDPTVNIQCAEALAARSQYDQAIACLHRVEKVRPEDEEIQKLISKYAVQKTIDRGQLEKGDSSKRQQAATTEGPEISREDQLKQLIKRKPKDLPNYHELAQIYIDGEKYEDAADLMQKAHEVSGHDADVRERWEDVQLRALRQKMVLAQDKADEGGGDAAKATVAKAQKALIDKEVEVFEKRVERYPNNLEFKFKLGQRYQMAGRHNDAIKQFQLSRTDPRRKGVCMLCLGQCFQKIKQNQLAINHYEMAIKEIPDRDAENKKTALYLAGKIALQAGDLETAEKHLTTLAGLDFTYRDVSALLDTIAKTRENNAG